MTETRQALLFVLMALAFAVLPPSQALAQDDGAALVPLVKAGYTPGGETLSIAAHGTGRTTGHIADLSVTNNGDKPIELPPHLVFIPSDGRHQSYVGRPAAGHVIAAGANAVVPLIGYCATVRRPPVPPGEPMPPPEEWIVASGETGAAVIPAVDNPVPPGAALIPGSDTPVPRAVSVNDEPLVAAPLLFAAVALVEEATSRLQESGDITTPFSANQERERQALNQQTIWIFAAELENDPYTQDQFASRLEAQYEDSTGVPIAEASDEDREQLEQGANDFWGAFELVGAEAKVINVRSTGAEARGATATGTETKPKASAGSLVSDEQEPPPEEVADFACKASEGINHTPRVVDATVSDSYGDDETRKKITDGLKEAVQSENNVYATATPPSTVYAIWRDDHVGGVASGYAKSVFLEDDGQEWVWYTDPIAAHANGTGTHTLTFTHGPECTSVVAGAASMWIKASSNAFDPLENSIEYFRALDAAKEISVKFATRKLPPGLSDAIEAGVDAITDPSSDTHASAMGGATVTVGGKSDRGEARNNVVYKREDKEDKAIIGGGATVKKLKATDVRPGSLTSKITASAELKAGASGNGYAKSNLESLYGTILVGVCECPNGILRKVVTDTSQFTKSDVSSALVNRAMKEMQEAAGRIDDDIASGEQEIDGDSLRRRAEAELGAWAQSNGGDRFAEDGDSGAD